MSWSIRDARAAGTHAQRPPSIPIPTPARTIAVVPFATFTYLVHRTSAR